MADKASETSITREMYRGRLGMVVDPHYALEDQPTELLDLTGKPVKERPALPIDPRYAREDQPREPRGLRGEPLSEEEAMELPGYFPKTRPVRENDAGRLVVGREAVREYERNQPVRPAT